MAGFIIRRVFQMAVVLLLLSFLVYLLIALMPGDPLDIACSSDPRCSPNNIAAMKRALGFDEPVWTRWGIWIGRFVQGELGYSRMYRQPVTQILGPRLYNTFVLSSWAMVVSIVIGLPLGVYTSLRPRTRVDYIVNMGAFVGISMPSFWLGLMLIIAFAVKLGWLPASGSETIGMAANLPWWERWTDTAKYLVLPVVSLSLQTIAQYVRFTRASMLDVLRRDFVRTAKSKGLSRRRVIYMHAFRNALIPVVTIVTLNLPIIFQGALITETVFAYHGVGELIFNSIQGNDYNVAMCGFMIACLAIMAMNLVADLGYAFLDPRITLQ